MKLVESWFRYTMSWPEVVLSSVHIQGWHISHNYHKWLVMPTQQNQLH